MKSIKKQLFEGRGARIAAGVTGAGLGIGGLAFGRAGQEAEAKAAEKLRAMEAGDQGAAGKGLTWLTGVKPSDIAKQTEEYKITDAARIAGKTMKEVGYGTGGLGAAVLGGAIVAGSLAKGKQNQKGR